MNNARRLWSTSAVIVTALLALACTSTDDPNGGDANRDATIGDPADGATNDGSATDNPETGDRERSG
jgi:hypothetical protein